MTDKNKIILTLGLIFGVLGFVTILIYRPWIMDNDYKDFRMNEFLPSFFYTIGFCLIGASISKNNPKKTMIFIALGSITYEIEQMFTDKYFDLKDLISIIIAFFIGLFIYQKMVVKHSNYIK